MEILATLGQAGVTEIAAKLGVHKSTVSRTRCGAGGQRLRRAGLRTGQVPAGLRDHPAGPVDEAARLDLVKQSQAACDALAADSGETTNVAILDGDRIVNVAEAVGPAGIALRTWVGQSCPAHATSSGKVLLAALAADDLRDRLAATSGVLHRRHGDRRAALEAELRMVRERGWASVREELEVGLNAVAAPV